MKDKPWSEQYDQGVPHSLQPYPQSTLLDIVSTTTQQRPDHTAMLFKGARIAYSELERLSDAFSAGLVALGVKKGDRVAFLLPNCPQFVIAQLGIWKAFAQRGACQCGTCCTTRKIANEAPSPTRSEYALTKFRSLPRMIPQLLIPA